MKNLLIVLFVLVSSISIAQDMNVEYFFAGQITNYETGKKEGNVTVSLMSGGRIVGSSITATNGKYTLATKLPAKSNFEVVFSKPGFVSKKIQYNFKDMNTERMKDGQRLTPNADLSLELFTVKPTIDFTFLEKEPVAIFDLDDENKVLPKLDIAASQRMKQKIEGLLTNPVAQPDNKDANYNSAIKSGESLLGAKKYADALKQFEIAAGIKPKEFYPQKKIAEIDALLKAQKDDNAAVSEVDNQYNNLIKAADNFRDNKQYAEAIGKYNAALRVKYEQYPKDEIKKLEDLLAEVKKAEKANNSYQEAIAAADVAFNAKNYKIAESRYQEAIAIKPTEKYPKDQLAKVTAELKKMEDAAENQKKYDDLINSANQLFTTSKFEEAKAKYQEALVLMPKEILPKEKIKTCDEMIAKNALATKTEADINRLFEEGQKLIDGKSYAAAKGKYAEIIALDPKKTLAYVKIDDIDRMIKAEEDAKNADKIIKGYVSEGDLAVKEERFDDAKMKFGAALEVREDPALREKYNALLAKIANKQAKDLIEKKYLECLQAAKLLLDAEKYEEARVAYQACANLDESKLEPKERLAEIDAKLAKKSEEDKNYRSFLDKGDALVKEEKYLSAIEQYNKALLLRPTEKEPKDKADEAERLERAKGDVANEQFEKIINTAKSKIEEKDFDKATELLKRAISLRSPERSIDKRPENLLEEIKTIKENELKYNESISNGEKLAKDKKYDLAIQKFEEASKVKPDEKLPLDRIEQLKKEKNEQLNKTELEASFNEFYNKGIAAKTAKTYELALENFKKASGYKPNDRPTLDHIAEIQQILDDQKMLENKSKEERAVLASMIKAADELFNKGDWGEAKTRYKAIVDFDKNQAHAKARIVECDLKLTAEMYKTANDDYKALVASADNKFEQKDFLRSKELFTSANKQRPDDSYVKKRLQDLDLLINPKVIKSSSLEALGDVYTGADGEADLAKADLERKNEKHTEFSQIKNTSIAKMEAEGRKDDLEGYGTKDAIEKVKTKSQQISIEAKENLTLKGEQVKDLQRVQNDVENQNNLFEQGDMYKTQANLNSKKSDVSEINYLQSQEYTENAKNMSGNISKLNAQKDRKSNEYNSKNIQNSKDLANASIEAQNAMSDDAERRATQVLIEKSHHNSISESQEFNQQNFNKIQETAQDIKNTKIVQQNDAINASNKLASNTEALKEVESKLIDQNVIAYNHEMENYLQTKERINDQEKVGIRKSNDAQERIHKNNRQFQNTVEKTSQINDSKNKKEQTDNTLMQLDLGATKKKYIEINTKSSLEESENILKVESSRAKVLQTDKSMKEKAEDKNLNSRADIETLISTTADKNQKTIEKQLKNAKMVKEMESITITQSENNRLKSVENQQVLTKKMNDINTSPQHVLARNTLGDEFPTGVTEEKFSQNGPDGKIKTIITRRIVVVDGHGDVYIRTQTNGISTYKKNDKPINEYTWQKETQNSSLVRH